MIDRIGPALGFEWLVDEGIMVFVMGKRDARPEEWDRYLEALRAVSARPDLRVFSYTAGGKPSIADQARIADVTRDKPWQIAVLGDSIGVRFIVSSFALINPNIRCFASSEVPAALAHLRCSDAEEKRVAETLARLRRSVGAGEVATGPISRRLGTA